MPIAPRTKDAATSLKQSRLSDLLDRPADQRLREYKYRVGQSIVFGIPVIVLHFWGASLGPADSPRWSSLFQSLLCGWIVYVNLGILFEGLVNPRLRLRGDFITAALAVLLYAASLISALHGIITSRLWYPLLFYACVVLLGAWSGWRWYRLSRER